MAIFLRQRWLILINLLIFVGLAVAFSLILTPKFRSISSVLIEDAPREGVVDAQDPLLAMEVQETTANVPTQVEVLQSTDVLFGALDAVHIKRPTTPEEVNRLPRIKVEQVLDTNVIEVSVDADTEDLSQRLATAIPAVYRDYIRAKQLSAVDRALNFVRGRIEGTKGVPSRDPGYQKGELRELAEATAALSRFKKKNKVVDTTNELAYRLADTHQAELDKNAADAQLKAAQGALDEAIRVRKALPPLIDVPTTQTYNPEVESARLQLESLQQQRKKLAVDYREGSTPLKKIDAQIKSQEAYIASIEKTLTNVTKTRNPDISIYDQRVAQAKADLKAAQQRRAAVGTQAAAKKGNLENLNPIAREQQELERQVQEHQTALLRLADTEDRLRLRNNSLKAPVSNVTDPTLPIQVVPRWALNIAIGVFVGLLFGCGFAISRDASQDRAHTERDVRWASGLDILARLPLVPGRIGALIWRSGDRLALDRFRLLRSNLVLASEGLDGAIVRHGEGTSDEGLGTREESQVAVAGNGGFKPSLLLPYSSPNLTSLVVTSTFQNEGKSMVAANLATAIAMDERRVILVDANLRAPSVHKSFDVEQTPGLSEVLYGKVPLEEALRPTTVEWLRIMTSGELPLNPSGVLASSEMLALHEKLKSLADIVIYDTVSSYALADAHALAAIVGSVLIVTQLGVARKDDMREAITSLAMTKARVLGVVLNKDRGARTVLS